MATQSREIPRGLPIQSYYDTTTEQDGAFLRLPHISILLYSELRSSDRLFGEFYVPFLGLCAVGTCGTVTERT